MISKVLYCRRPWFAVLVVFLPAGSLMAGYKARPWPIRAPDTYTATLTSEALTIATEPLYRDALAAAVFDKSDIVTRGIIPLAVVIFNDNDFPVTVESASIELINGDEHIHTLLPQEAVHQVFKKSGKSFIPQVPGPTQIPSDKLNADALADFEQKFLASKIVEPHAKAGGFLYLRLPGGSDVTSFLSGSRLYIPEVYRQDTGAKMMFFEIELKPALTAAPTK